MIIKTKNFRTFSKIIEMFDKKGGTRVEESIYFDFEQSIVYFGNGEYSAAAEGILGHLAFDFEFENDTKDDFENMWFNTRLFLTLAKQYEELYMSTDYEFYNGDEKFKIPCFSEASDYPDVNKDDFEVFNIHSELIENLKTAQSYMGADDFNENFAGIQLFDNAIVASDGAAVFEAYTVDETFPDIQISANVLRVILTGSEEHTCKMYHNDDTDDLYFTFGEDELLHIASTQIDNLRVPPIKDQDYIDKYDHDTQIVVEKQALLEILNFFEVFVKDLRNEQMYMSVLDDNILSIESKSENQGNRQIGLKECSTELVGAGLWFARKYLAKAVTSIKDDFIRIKIDVNEPAFNVIGESQTSRSIAIIMLADDLD